MKRFLLSLIRFYQRNISPAFPPRCRFRPTCSAYAYEAICRYGALRGGWLAIKISGVDIDPGTEGDTILNSVTFG